jgi:hypothetical protein
MLEEPEEFKTGIRTKKKRTILLTIKPTSEGSIIVEERLHAFGTDVHLK